MHRNVKAFFTGRCIVFLRNDFCAVVREVLCDSKIDAKFMARAYKASVRLTMIYDVDTIA